MSNTNFRKVCHFHEHFGLRTPNMPVLLDEDEQRFRLTCLHEELGEYEEAVVAEDAEGQLDALVDLIYFAYGTAHRNGWDIDEAFKRVHDANMKKQIIPGRQRRGWVMEINKPDGWQAPVLDDLVHPDHVKFLKPGEFTSLKGLVVLDGPDGSGKTTLGKRIAEVTGGEYLHLTWSQNIEENMEQYRKAMLDLAEVLSKEKVVIIDRAWLSNPIYSNIYRGGHVTLDERGHPLWPIWKERCEENNALNIIAVPSDREKWFALYQHMVATRHEVYAGESDSKMRAVYELFNDYVNGLTGVYGTPNLGRTIAYDMFEASTGQALDSWILNNVISTLEV